MSSNPASPSGSSDRSLPTFSRARDASSDLAHADSSVSGRKLFEHSNSQLKQNFNSVQHQEPSGLPRSYHGGLGNHEVVASTRNRSSGGFLLDSSTTPSRLAFLSRSKNDTTNGKAKSKRDGSGLTILKRRDRHPRRSSIGSSPLATKVSTLDDDADNHVQDHPGLPSSVVCENGDTKRPTLQDGPQATVQVAELTQIGYSTDPMQIVNLALSLSEGRRRQTSRMRVTSGDTGIRRSISTSRGIRLQATRPNSGLGVYLQSERQFSRNISPQAHPPGERTPMKTHKKSSEISGSYLHPITIDGRDFELQDGLYDVSDATIARVQKAKDHFELLYEHRRLLAHLPPLRRSTQGSRESDIEGRAYNPLQYIRNRKVRSPEKKPIESDVDGWHDVQQVRAWVSAIIDGHTGRRTDPDECIRLPELPHPHTEANQENADPTKVDSPSSITRKRDFNQSTKPRRPQPYWVVSPAELLADAYWLEQGLNKTKMEDRDGNRIYPWNTELKYTGWRNRTPAHEQGSQQPSHPPDSVENSKADLPDPISPPELPIFTSTGRKGKPRGRRRRRETRQETGSESEQSDSRSHKKRKGLRKSLIKSLSRSSTSGSDDERGPGALSRARKEENEGSAAESSALDYYMRKMLDRDARHFTHSQAAHKSQTTMERSRPTTKDHVWRGSQVASSKERVASEKSRGSDNLLESVRDSLDKRRRGRLSLDVERPARVSLDDDTTAPNSPSFHQFPSIAINLSPPHSRSSSPTKKALHARINPFRDRNQSKQRHGIDTADFADAQPSLSLQPTRSEIEKEASLFDLGSRDTSPMTKNSRRTSDASIVRGDSQRTQSTASKSSVKGPTSPDPVGRIRGIFKGGRIAELVGNEVSRVGDFIWKREPPPTTRTSSSASSAKSPQQSDMEEEVRANGALLKKPTQPHTGLVSTSSDGKTSSPAHLRSPFSVKEKPAYFMSNLPSFTSPFQKDREVQEERDRAPFLTPESSPPNARGSSDHISNAVAHHRSVSKSPRLDRLAPPKLTISRSTSPAGSPEGHRGSYDFGKTSTFARPANASRGLNDALDRPRGGPPVTGLTNLKASKSGADLTRNWDPSARDPSTERTSTTITKKDIARARALLLSSGAKARQISLQVHLIRHQPPQFLLNTVPIPPSPQILQSLRVPRKDEHFLAARNLISTLTAQSTRFRTSLDHFTSTISPSLHTSLQALDDLVDNTLTPRVRAAADESGELSMKLTTTSTLAVKGLNDVVEGALRRRRRGPVRWLRRFGYGIVEWMVVGLLWAIWGVVSVFRVVLGAFRVIWGVGRWLLWLD